LARNIASTVENSFVNGILTEATALNFPEGAATESYNCVYLLKANVVRRYGLDFEPNYVLNTVNRSEVVVNTYLWQNASGSGNNNFVVLQVGSLLSFFAVNSDGALSTKKASTTVDLIAYLAPGATNPAQTECQFAFGKGYLFVTHPQLVPFYCTFDPLTGSFSSSIIAIKIRDFDGIPEPGLSNETRPSDLSDIHWYNLRNQGWAGVQSGGLNDMTVTTTTTIAYPTGYNAGDQLGTWRASRNDVPSNSDIWWLYKDASNVMQPKLANADLRGNSPAPKGHYILDSFYQDRSAVSGVGAFTPNSAGAQRPRAVCFFAGRVWYAGVDAQGFSNRVYFSQLVRSEQEFGLCHQTNDPTSEFSFDLLATDGGMIQILDCGTIIKMVSMQSSLIIFASNGVWSISGSQGIGFTAVDYSVRKLSSVPSVSAASFVDIAGTPAWWNTDGIYTIGGNDTLGQAQVTSVTEKKIKTFFDAIPAGNKAYAKGYYNSLTKVVQWCYRSTEPDTFSARYEFDTILNMNVVTGAFYPWKIGGSGVRLNSIVAIQGTASTTQAENVTDSFGNLITNGAGNIVAGRISSSKAIASFFKYLVSYPVAGSNYNMTFAEASDTSYTDFLSYNGIGADFESYLVSGFKVHGDGQKRFQTNYLYLYCGNDRPSKFYCQAIWDYASSPAQGDMGSRQLVQWAAQDRKYRYKRLKIRGMGLSLQFKISSITGQPFDVVGWSAFETGNASI
jgi:hypothetical protein